MEWVGTDVSRPLDERRTLLVESEIGGRIVDVNNEQFIYTQIWNKINSIIWTEFF
jgi:pantothenate kinase-related protein Tda10